MICPRPIAAVVAMLLLLAGCQAGKAPTTQGAIIEGITIQDGIVTALPGFEFEPLDDWEGRGEKVVLRRVSTQGVEGTFNCYCTETDSTNGCRARIIGDTLKCQPTVCKDCDFVVDIGSLKALPIATLILPCTRTVNGENRTVLQADAND